MSTTVKEEEDASIQFIHPPKLPSVNDKHKPPKLPLANDIPKPPPLPLASPELRKSDRIRSKVRSVKKEPMKTSMKKKARVAKKSKKSRRGNRSRAQLADQIKRIQEELQRLTGKLVQKAKKKKDLKMECDNESSDSESTAEDTQKSIKVDIKCIPCPTKKPLMNREKYKKSNNFICDLCNRNFWQSSDLKRHMRTHDGKRPFKCKQCDKSYTQVGTLYRHMRSAHNIRNPGKANRSFVPSIDMKNFVQKGADKKTKKLEITTIEKRRMKEYMKKMEDKKKKERMEHEFRCTECSATFGQSSDLKRHMRTHSGMKPFQCPHCPKAYTQRGSLYRHADSAHQIKLRIPRTKDILAVIPDSVDMSDSDSDNE